MGPCAAVKEREAGRWRRQPEFVAGGMIIGLVAAWLTAICLLLWSVESAPDTALLRRRDFYLVMAVPLLLGGCVSVIRAVRRWAAGLVVGATVGWALGLASLGAVDCLLILIESIG